MHAYTYKYTISYNVNHNFYIMTIFWTIIDILLNLFCIDVELEVTINFQ